MGCTFAAALRKSLIWAHNSVGSEWLPYKQQVGGSSPSVPTIKNILIELQTNVCGSFFCWHNGQLGNQVQYAFLIND